MSQLVRHGELRDAHEIDRHQRGDVGDGVGGAGDIGPVFEFAVEELQELRDARLVGLAPRGTCGSTIGFMAGCRCWNTLATGRNR